MPEFKPMLAKDGDLSKIKFPVVGQQKLDGIRASVVNGKLVSRTLKPIPNAAIREALERPEFEGFDGELIVGAPESEDCYRKTTSFVMSQSKTGQPWAYMVFDKWNAPGGFTERYESLAVHVETKPGHVPIFLVESVTLNDAIELDLYEQAVVAAGHEGVIVRVPDAPYKFGRSGKTGPLLKVKRFVDFEAEVIGVYEQMHNANEAKRNALGRTERSTAKAGLVPAGVLGGLVVRAINGPAEGVEFEVGTGFSAAERALYWTQATVAGTIKGRIAKVKSFPIGVKDKPRHPVFLGWRDTGIDG